MVQYCVCALYVAKIDGNRFYNGILFGLGEASSMVISNILMKNFDDMTAFYINMSLGLISYVVLIFFPTQGIHTYTSIFILIGSIGGWVNILFLIIELRVPNNKVGSVTMLCMTIAVGTAMVSPFVSTLPAPVPFAFLLILSLLALLVSFFLPPPGLHLPAAQQTGPHSI